MKNLEDVWYLKEIQKDGFETELLKKQIAKFEEICIVINKQFETYPTVGHGGTPHILDNSKGKRMKKTCDKHDDKTRKLFEMRDLQIDKIQKTCNSINYKKYTRNIETKKSEKFINKNPINEIIKAVQIMLHNGVEFDYLISKLDNKTYKLTLEEINEKGLFDE